MEFDWNNAPFEWDSSLTPRDVEESFEDPFAIKLLPDSPRFSVQARFFNLGRSAGGLGVFSVYRTNGNKFGSFMPGHSIRKNSSSTSANSIRR